MKINLTYGIGIAVASALFTFALYFAGVHNDAEKMQSTSMVVGAVGFLIPVVGVVLALRATRAAAPDGGLTYGKGVVTALLVGVFAGLAGGVFNYVYSAIINPGMTETIREMQMAAFEEQGMTQQQIDAAAGMMGFMTNPVFTSLMAVIVTPIFYTLIGLIASIFLKRQPVAVPPPTPAV